MPLAMPPTVGGDRVPCQVFKHKNLTTSPLGDVASPQAGWGDGSPKPWFSSLRSIGQIRRGLTQRYRFISLFRPRYTDRLLPRTVSYDEYRPKDEVYL